MISYLPCLWHKDIRGLDKIMFSKSTRKGKYEVSHDSCSYFLCTAWEASESKRSLSYMIHSQGMALGLSNMFWHFPLTFCCPGQTSLMPPQPAWEGGPGALVLPCYSIQFSKYMLNAHCVPSTVLETEETKGNNSVSSLTEVTVKWERQTSFLFLFWSQ